MLRHGDLTSLKARTYPAIPCVVVVVVVVVSHIQRIHWLPTRKKTTLHGGQSRSWSAEQEQKKEKVWQHAPVNMRRHTIRTVYSSMMYVHNGSLRCSVFPTYSSPQPTVSTDALHNNAPRGKYDCLHQPVFVL